MIRSVAAIALSTLALASCSSTAKKPAATTPPGAGAVTPATAASPATAPPANPRQVFLERFARGYYPGRSGQIFLVTREGDFITQKDPLYAFMHGSPWAYDSRIPILFHGPPFIRQRQFTARVAQQDVVPTLHAGLA